MWEWCYIVLKNLLHVVKIQNTKSNICYVVCKIKFTGKNLLHGVKNKIYCNNKNCSVRCIVKKYLVLHHVTVSLQ